MSACTPTGTIAFLQNYNAWRRGDETLEMPRPAEIGANIQDAIVLLRKYDSLLTEGDQLRAEVERLKTCGIVELAAINSSVLEYCKHWEARAERAEADLATERARLDWLMAGGMCLVQHSGGFHVSRLHCQVSRAAIDLGMKEDAK